MSNLVAEIRSGLGAIAEFDDSYGAYRDFHSLLSSADVNMDVIQALSFGTTLQAREAIDATRKSKAAFLAGNSWYFRGSGIIAMATDDGTLLGVTYEHRANSTKAINRDMDPVAHWDPGYRASAFKKLGLGLLVAHQGYYDKYPDMNRRYDIEQTILETLGIADVNQAPHTIGYDVLPLSRNRFSVAAASGMLPSPAVTRYWDSNEYTNSVIADGFTRRWWLFPEDVAAGYHDLVAARTALNALYNTHLLDRRFQASAREAGYLDNGQRPGSNMNIHNTRNVMFHHG